MFDLRGSRVLIAGGSSGIGLATAELLVNCGAAVVLNGRDRGKLGKVKERLGTQASIAAFDAANPRERNRAFATMGSFDHLVVALSGGKGAGPFTDVATADLRSGFEAKFWVHFSLAQESLAHNGRTPECHNARGCLVLRRCRPICRAASPFASWPSTVGTA